MGIFDTVERGFEGRSQWLPCEARNMAERVGFEPTIPVKVCPLSRRIVSTTHAPLRKNSCRLTSYFLLSASSKKLLYDLGRLSGQDAASYFYLMIQTRLVPYL